MKRLIYLRHAFPALTAIATLLASTSTSCEASYKPPFVPISVSINDRGELSVSFDAAIVTPAGTFSLSAKPKVAKGKDDSLLEIQHQRANEQMKSIFVMRDFGKGKAELAVTGGSGVRKSGNRTKTTIKIPPGAQKFTLDVENHDAVQPPSTTSSTSWSAQPTTTQPTTTGTTTTRATTTGPTTTTTTTPITPTTGQSTTGQSTTKTKPTGPPTTTSPPSTTQLSTLTTKVIPTTTSR